MTDSQIADINNRLDTLTQRVNNIELLTGTIGTSQAAIAQIYTRLDRFAEVTNSNFNQVTERFDRLEGKVDEILRILSDRIESQIFPELALTAEQIFQSAIPPI